MTPTLDTMTPEVHPSASSCTSSPLAPPWTFQGMLDGLEAAFNRDPKGNKVDVDELWHVLESYKSNKDDWGKYAYYDERKYKRNLVAEYEKYNIMLICWAPGSSSCIHNHAGAHCFMKTLEGELIESRFAWPDEEQLARGVPQEMSVISENRMNQNEVRYINDKVGLHRVSNLSNSQSVSLHVYIPPYRKCKAFDQSTGRARECQLTFYSEKGTVIGRDETNPWLKP